MCCSLWGCKESDMTEQLNLLTSKGKRVLSCRSSQPNRHMIFEAHRSLLSAARIPAQCLCGLSPLQKGLGLKTWENALDTVMMIDTKWVVSLKSKEATVLGEGWQGATVRLQWEPGQESKSGR